MCLIFSIDSRFLYADLPEHEPVTLRITVQSIVSGGNAGGLGGKSQSSNSMSHGSSGNLRNNNSSNNLRGSRNTGGLSPPRSSGGRGGRQHYNSNNLRVEEPDDTPLEPGPDTPQ